MPWLQVQAGQDHLLQYAKRNPIDALTELIWNGLDAEANEVDVTVETRSLGGDDPLLSTVVSITVRDNGHGITPEIAVKSFPSLGDSWKKGLNGRTLNQIRILHGSKGRGRFATYSLGHRVRWTSVSKDEAGKFHQIEILGDAKRVNGFDIEEPVDADGPAGTVVVVDVEQERSLPSLMDGEVHLALAARLAAHLLGNPDIRVSVDGEVVDPKALIQGDPLDIELSEVDPSVLVGRETPVLTIVEWTSEMKNPLGLSFATPGEPLCGK